MITSRTRTIAIIGDPIGHSITPRIQNFALQHIGAEITNVAFRVAPENLAQAVRGARALGLLGLMVTIPHKEAVLDLCDELDESARLIGAANLLHFRDDGATVGYSSDGWGALKSLEEEGAAIKNQRVVILGGGGSARSLALTFAREGAREIVLLNRTVERAQKIADEVAALGTSARANSTDASTCSRELASADVLVNTTSIGMSPRVDESPLDAQVLAAAPKSLTVYDIVYNPLETQLLRDARALGLRAVDGLGMLIYTNVFAVKQCAGLDISASVMREEALSALSAF
jgi:shikimate dehydrogenase